MFRKKIKYTFTILNTHSLYINPAPGYTHSSEGLSDKTNSPYEFPYLWTDDATQCLPIGLWSVNQAGNTRIELYHSVGEHGEKELDSIFQSTPNVNNFSAENRFIKRIYQYLDGLDSDNLKIIIAYNQYMHSSIKRDISQITDIINQCITHIAFKRTDRFIHPFVEEDSRLIILPLEGASCYLTADGRYGLIEDALTNTVIQIKAYLKQHSDSDMTQSFLREVEDIEKAKGSYFSLPDRTRLIFGLEALKKMAHKKLVNVDNPLQTPDAIVSLMLIAFDSVSGQPSLPLLDDWWESVRKKIQTKLEDTVDQVRNHLKTNAHVSTYTL